MEEFQGKKREYSKADFPVTHTHQTYTVKYSNRDLTAAIFRCLKSIIEVNTQFYCVKARVCAYTRTRIIYRIFESKIYGSWFYPCIIYFIFIKFSYLMTLNKFGFLLDFKVYRE